jgi:hypothetical protein
MSIRKYKKFMKTIERLLFDEAQERCVVRLAVKVEKHEKKFYPIQRSRG